MARGSHTQTGFDDIATSSCSTDVVSVLPVDRA